MIRRVVYNTLVLHYDCGLVPKEKDYQVGSLTMITNIQSINFNNVFLQLWKV